MSAAPRVVATIVHSSRVSCFTRLLCPPPASPLKGEVLRDAAGTRSRVVVRCIHHRLLLTRLSLNPAGYPLLAHQLRGRGHRGAVGASSQVPVARRVAQSLQTSPDVEDTRSCYDSNEAPRHEQRVLWQRLRESLLWWGQVSMEKQESSLSREFTEAAGSEHPQLLRADHMSPSQTPRPSRLTMVQATHC